VNDIDRVSSEAMCNISLLFGDAVQLFQIPTLALKIFDRLEPLV